jgi:ABC-type multidrug transport system ATPase subunit
MDFLTVRAPDVPPREVTLQEVQVTIGRDAKANIPIGLPTPNNPSGMPGVSRVHARFVRRGPDYYIEDLSKYGTYLQGKRLPPHQEVLLEDGNVIRIIGSHGNVVSLHYHKSGRSLQTIGTKMLSHTVLANVAKLTLGRDPSNNIPLPSPLVSRYHAEITQSPHGYAILDKGSANGTFVNGSKIRRAILAQGDVIHIGPYKFVFDRSALQHSSTVGGVRIDAISLRKEVPTKQGSKLLLRDISLSILPREFVGIVGGSGSGKSTLMDAMNGARPVSHGQVLVNGDDLYGNFHAYSGIMGYVPQADILHTGLNVDKALRYTAQLRFPPDTPNDEIENRIDTVLKTTDMQPQKQQAIQELSGGQRKRINIASELLSEPSLLFLDEPTSGLDPGLDKKMMQTLSEIADGGRTVALITHATNNIIGCCDLIVFLAYGRLAYFGPPEESLRFFNSPDFATIYSKLDTEREAALWEDRFKKSPLYHEYIVKRSQRLTYSKVGTTSKSSRRFDASRSLRQLGVLTRRYLNLIVSDRFSLFILLAVMPLIGLLLLVIAKAHSLVGDSADEITRILADQGIYNITGDAQTLLQVMALTVIMLGAFASAYEIIKERSIYERERMINLGIMPYLLSKILVLTLFGCVQCLAFLAVIALKVAIPGSGVLLPGALEIYVTLVLGTLSGICLGLVISASVKSSNNVVYIMLVVLILQIVFSGAMFNLPDAAKPLSYLTQTRWAMEALGSTVNMNALNGLNQIAIQTIGAIPLPSTFQIDYDSTTAHLILAWVIQLFYAFALAIAAGVILKRQDKL